MSGNSDREQAEYLEQVAFMLKKASDRYAEQQRNPNPLADRLIEACIAGKTGEVKWLLHKKNVNPNVVRVFGTPAGSAVMSPNSIEILSELSKAAVNLDLQDQNGWNALYIAAANDRFEVIHHLVQLGASLDLPCPDNQWTALINASSFGHHRSVIELLSLGATATLKSSDGLTAADIANANHHSVVVQVLRRYFEILSRR